MIVVILNGRLGHQLISYAAGLALGKYNGEEVAVHKKCKEYYLDKLGIFPEIVEKIDKIDLTENKNERFQYNSKFFKNRNCVIKGCWQHPRYTEEVLPELKEKIKSFENKYTSIHIRRGDYLKVRKNLVVDTDYIEEAKKLLPGPYCVVSDDIEGCENNILADKYLSSSPVEDFKFLCGSKNLILSASSFSGGAGRLSKGQVVAPKNWIPESWEGEKEHHICPESWRLL